MLCAILDYNYVLRSSVRFHPVSCRPENDEVSHRGAPQLAGAYRTGKDSVEMNASGPVREDGQAGSTVPSFAGTAEGGLQVEYDNGVLDESKVQEPGSK